MKKKWTREDIVRTYAKAFRINKLEADDAADSIEDCIKCSGSSLDKWISRLVSWGWQFYEGPKKAHKEVARLMRAFGIKSKLVYTCAECGGKVEVKG